MDAGEALTTAFIIEEKPSEMSRTPSSAASLDENPADQQSMEEEVDELLLNAGSKKLLQSQPSADDDKGEDSTATFSVTMSL